MHTYIQTGNVGVHIPGTADSLVERQTECILDSCLSNNGKQSKERKQWKESNQSAEFMDESGWISVWPFWASEQNS